jgi:YD repeat-containing protein
MEVNMRKITKEDILDYQIACTTLSTGGGGVAPSLEAVAKRVDEALDEGLEFKLVDLDEIPDDRYVFSSCGTGGGVQTEMKMKWTGGVRNRLQRDHRYSYDRAGRIKDQIMMADREWCPLNTWSEIPGPNFRASGAKRLAELIGEEPYSSIQFEVAPGFIRTLLSLARQGKPFIDATVAGHRAAPEIAQNGLNLANIPCTPAVYTTSQGDRLILEKTLCFQRMEELTEGISTYSGGGASGLHAVKGKDLKKAAFPGAVSLTMKVGKAIRGALKAGKPPVDAMLKALGPLGYKLFEGEIFDYWQDDKYGFIWGTAKIKGTGPCEGHDMRIWYKNEHHISWLDGRPYVTSPDGINVVDPVTGWGLANFWPGEWEPGRPVVVTGVKAEEQWETPMGLKIFGPQHFRWDIEHVPLEKAYKKLC